MREVFSATDKSMHLLGRDMESDSACVCVHRMREM